MDTTPLLCNRSDQPLPEVESPHVILAPMALEVGIVAGLFQCGDDVDVFTTKRTDALVYFGQLQLAALRSQLTPAALEFVVLSRLCGRAGEVVQYCAEGDGSAHPFGQGSEFGERSSEYSR